MNSEWYCEIDGVTAGPFTVEELLKMAADGSLKPNDRVRRGKNGEWIDADQLPGMSFLAGMSGRAKTRPSRPIPEPSAEESEINILARGFDSPVVRAERLLVLTGGTAPIEHNRTCKVVCQRSNTGFFRMSSTPLAEHLADVVFTDTGLLLTNYATLPKRGEGGNQGWMHFGIIGLIVYSIIESRRMSRGKTEAETNYYQMVEKWEQAPLSEVFMRVIVSEFIPADEITRAKVRSSGVLKFRFRGFQYTLRPDRKADHPSMQMLSDDEFQTWLQEASAARAAQNGGPDKGSPGAVSEWSARSANADIIPPWVVSAIHRMEERWGNNPKELYRWIPKPHHADIFRRFAEIESPAAAAWHLRFGKRLRFPGWICLAVSIIAGLARISHGLVSRFAG